MKYNICTWRFTYLYLPNAKIQGGYHHARLQSILIPADTLTVATPWLYFGKSFKGSLPLLSASTIHKNLTCGRAVHVKSVKDDSKWWLQGPIL